MKQEKGGGGGKKLGQWLGAPARAVSRACDAYVRKMRACAGGMPTQYACNMGRGGGHAAMYMQAAAFSSRSTRRVGSGGDDDVGELVRAMSQREQGSGASPVSVTPRSRSVAVGRIDEDAPCEFGADACRLGLPPPAVRRIRSAAVGAGLPPRVGGAGFGAATKQAAVGAGLPPRVGGAATKQAAVGSGLPPRVSGAGFVHGG